MTLGIGGRIGIGFGLPGFNISIGGGIGIGGRKGGCKSHNPSKKWIQLHNVKAPDVLEAAKFAVDAFNKKYENNLEFQYVTEAWVHEVNNEKEYSIELVAKDCFHRLLEFHAVVIEKTVDHKKIWILVSFERIFD
ncbi:phloem filament protein [Cucumis melo var. makuwa]|uniref:Phloem filament protein n=3 Tax=Cucumis melo TaxID=3656 RepID=A0A5A7SQL4_CUCMM|nr:phloem filament protein [Cucumis melo subsp. melo]KAA0031425.1 phloem filament protein [Cucumis melo var. makuwa]